MKIILIGSLGKMGKTLAEIASNRHEIIGVDKIESTDFFEKSEKIGDVIVDFSSSEITDDLCNYALKTHTPAVIGTTGQTQNELRKIRQTSNTVPIFLSGNMSLGIALFAKHLKEIMKFFPLAEVDIIETHHTEKKDAPSGTALLLGKAVQSATHGKIIVGNSIAGREPTDIHILSRRMGKTVGEHTVVIHTENETFNLSHSAENRKIFAEGALSACEFVLKKEKGLFSIEDLIGG